MKFKNPFDFLFNRKAFTSQIMGLKGAEWKSKDAESYAKEGYMINNVGFRCVDIIAKNLASVPLILKKKVGDETVIVESHPLKSLLQRPNANKGGVEFFKNYASFHQIAGESFILADAEKNPSSLVILPPSKMDVVESENGVLPLAYIYMKGTQHERTYPVDPITGESQVLHWHTFNPLNALRGLSPFSAAAFAVDINNKVAVSNKALLDNDSRPAGIMRTKGNITAANHKTLKERIDSYHSGPQNSANFLLLDGGLEWQQMGLTPKDMDFLQSKNASALDIANVFGVPAQLLGLPDSQRFSNYAEARLSFWEDTMLPLEDSHVSELTHFLVPKFGDDTLFVDYNQDAISALEPRRRERFQSVQEAKDMTKNERRLAMGLPRIEPEQQEGMDLVYGNASEIPVGFDVFAEDLNQDSQKMLLKAWEDAGLTPKQAEIKLRRYQDYGSDKSQE